MKRGKRCKACGKRHVPRCAKVHVCTWRAYSHGRECTGCYDMQSNASYNGKS